MGSSAQDLSNKRFKRNRRDGKHRNNCVWTTIQSQLLVEAIQCVSRSGGALRFGLTRDQGAFAIGIYGEGDPYTEYMHSAEDCADFLREIIRDYSDDSGSEVKLGV